MVVFVAVVVVAVVVVFMVVVVVDDANVSYLVLIIEHRMEHMASNMYKNNKNLKKGMWCMFLLLRIR